MENINSLYQSIGIELNIGSLKNVEQIQGLWGGYGELSRLTFENSSVIIKHIKLPETSKHPYGWNTNISHQRKLKSYQVEVNWYEKFSKITDMRCYIPKGLKTYKTQNETIIVMEDLSKIGFSEIIEKASKTHIKTALLWLANFHARFLYTKSDLVWDIGTYWHLDTRPEELEALKDKELKKFSKEIDLKLKNSSFQTLVHGDAKLANFCFSKDALSCAAVDFQYVGHGCAMKDVVLFMSSAVEPSACKNMQEWVLDTYFEAFHKAIDYYHPNIDSYALEKEGRELFCIAWADFQRFVKGWKPNHFKINPYTESLTKKALSKLRLK